MKTNMELDKPINTINTNSDLLEKLKDTKKDLITAIAKDHCFIYEID